ncbi:ricin-like [Malania oleifera]|uniref:ricin-like n=1 Tax=Malania oleifera TaxID=397392 RepID=UPI0025AE41FB|nr:ricin-like [Malania oleifera]
MGLLLRKMVVSWMVVLATWPCLSTAAMADSGIDQPPKVLVSSGGGVHHDPQFNDYPKLTFTTSGTVSKNDYRQFVQSIRDRVANPQDRRHGIPVLFDPNNVSDNQRFLLVELSNNAEDVVTLAIDVTNMYVVAYRVRGESYFFQDAPHVAFSNLFTDTNQYTLTYGGNYADLLGVAGLSDLDRLDPGLGIQQLDSAIDLLFHRSGTHGDRAKVARSLIICILMISEAVRFRYVENEVARTISSHGYGTVVPNGAVVRLVRRWDRLSSAIQHSEEDGSFPPIQLQRSNYVPFTVSNVMPELVATIGIMLFICEKPPRAQYSLLIRPVVDAYNDETCTDEEFTVRIVGRNGLCADVKGGFFNNGDPIILWPCKSNADANQLWTVKKDGTIRSKGKCLTTYGYSSGSYVMIYDCASAVTEATHWEIWDNGTIINTKSSLVLSAESGNSDSTLTVQVNNYSSRQGWLATNESNPFVSTIWGFRDLCMQANGNDVWLEECVDQKVEQQWALYPDRSIRPNENRDLCLSYYENQSEDLTIVNIASCSSASSRERWIFQNDGTVLNLHLGLVMDVRRSDPSLHQIIMYPFHGNPNQQWFPMF